MGRPWAKKNRCLPISAVPLPPGTGGEDQLTLGRIIEYIVRSEVASFRERQSERRLVRRSLPARSKRGAAQGKISSGGAEIDPQQVDEEAAVCTARQAFVDGLYFVVIDEKQFRDLDSRVPLQPESRITFIRLTLLTGG